MLYNIVLVHNQHLLNLHEANLINNNTELQKEEHNCTDDNGKSSII